MRKVLLSLAFLLSPALYAQSNYHLPVAFANPQQQNFGSNGSVATLTPGSNTGVGQYAFSQPGVFTLAQQNDPYIWTLTGGGTCSPIAILNGVGTTIKLTDVLAGCANIPTSGVTNGFTNVFGAYGLNANGNNTGQFGNVGLVGFYSGMQCSGTGATPSHCWGANLAVTDLNSTGATMFGNEYDVTVASNSTTGAAMLLSFRGNGQPTADTFPGITISAATGTGKFTSGYECQPGSLVSPFSCVNLLPTGTGVANSNFLQFTAENDALATETATINFHLDNVILNSVPAIAVSHVSGEESYGIMLTATAAQPHGTLVKIDSAHADSFVICATTDTQCQGFVQGTNNTSGLCVVSSTFCPVVTTSGSKVQGILGTGTCAIDNPAGTRAFVIADTTTAGRVKCTSSQPAVGAYIGLSMSIQASVGSAVDILTKFQ